MDISKFNLPSGDSYDLKDAMARASLADKVDKEVGKGLSSNDYTTAEKNKLASGVAELDNNGKVLASQLPSYVDDVLEYSAKSAFPATGESGKIYVDTSTNLTYRWSGSAYVEISQSLALGETSSTAYRGDRGKIAYDHSQTTSGNPHNVSKSDIGLGNVENKSAATIIGEMTSTNITTALGYTPANATDLGDKVDKIAGKGLSTNDFTNAYKSKLDGIAAGAEVNVNPDWNATSGDAAILNKPTTIAGYGITDAYTISQIDATLADKVDKIDGKGLSENDYSDADAEAVQTFIATGLSVVDGMLQVTFSE